MYSAASATAQQSSKLFTFNPIPPPVPFMKRKYTSTFRNSDMDRAKPKRHIFRALINSKLKRHRSDTGLVEDRANSVTVVRLIIALLLIHLIVIGGVILRGKIKSGETAPIAQATITAPPAPAAPAQAAAPVNDVLPQPVEGPTANPVRTNDNSGHITQPPTGATTTVAAAQPEIVTPPVVDDVAEVADTPEPPVVATTEPADSTTQPVKNHHVIQGDTLFGIAAKYQVSVDAIRKANPQVKGNNIICGTYLAIPVRADSAAGREIAARQAEAAAKQAAKTYTIARGDTLKRIANKHNTTVSKLMQLNNIPKGKEGKIRIGDTLRIAD